MDVTGKWRLQKCKGSLKATSRKRARSLRLRSYGARGKECHCEDRAYKTPKSERRAHRHLSQSSRPREYTSLQKLMIQSIWLLNRCSSCTVLQNDWKHRCLGAIYWLQHTQAVNYIQNLMLQELFIDQDMKLLFVSAHAVANTLPCSLLHTHTHTHSSNIWLNLHRQYNTNLFHSKI